MSEEIKQPHKFKAKNQIKKYYNLVKYDHYTYDLKEITITPDGKVTETTIGNPEIYQHVLTRLGNMVRDNHIEAYEYGRQRKGTKIEVN